MHGANNSHTPSEPRSSPRPVYRARHDPDSAATLSTTVVHALAECMGIDVSDGDFCLYDCVNPDALDRLFRPQHDGTPRTDASLTFPVQRHRVTVYADGEIVIEPPTDAH